MISLLLLSELGNFYFYMVIHIVYFLPQHNFFVNEYWNKDFQLITDNGIKTIEELHYVLSQDMGNYGDMENAVTTAAWYYIYRYSS